MLSENWVNACIQVPGMLDSTGSIGDTRSYIWDTQGHMNTTCSNMVMLIHDYLLHWLGYYFPVRYTQRYALHSLVLTTSGDNGFILAILCIVE